MKVIDGMIYAPCMQDAFRDGYSETVTEKTTIHSICFEDTGLVFDINPVLSTCEKDIVDVKFDRFTQLEKDAMEYLGSPWEDITNNWNPYPNMWKDLYDGTKTGTSHFVPPKFDLNDLWSQNTVVNHNPWNYNISSDTEVAYPTENPSFGNPRMWEKLKHRLSSEKISPLFVGVQRFHTKYLEGDEDFQRLMSRLSLTREYRDFLPTEMLLSKVFERSYRYFGEKEKVSHLTSDDAEILYRVFGSDFAKNFSLKELEEMEL